jgi:hypothetical protein
MSQQLGATASLRKQAVTSKRRAADPDGPLGNDMQAKALPDPLSSTHRCAWRSVRHPDARRLRCERHGQQVRPEDVAALVGACRVEADQVGLPSA